MHAAARSAALALALALPAAADAAAGRDATIARTFALARTGGAPAVLAARAAAHARGDRTYDDVFGLALYVVDPKRFRGDFVAAYPTTADGVMGDYARAIGERHLVTSPTFPFSALGSIAAAGDPRALAKLVAAYAQSDGFAAETLAEAIRKAAATRPALALATLSASPPALRAKLVNDAGLWCDRAAATAIARVRTSAAADAASRARIAATARACPPG